MKEFNFKNYIKNNPLLKEEFKEGDKVKLTLKGLQQMNRGRTPGISNDYSRSLSKIRQNDIVGTVEKVFPKGSMNVDFGGVLYDIKDYMVVKEPVNEESFQTPQMSKREALRALGAVHSNMAKWKSDEGRHYMDLLGKAMEALGAHEAWE